MITISLCMIVKNEEDTIGRCLESVADIIDEIIIVDTGSSDKTKEIASCFTSNIYDFEWIDDFSAARNYSFSMATKEYLFWLDADDILLEDDRIKLVQLKQSMDNSIDVVMMRYNYSFDKQGNITLSHFRERLLKKSNNYKWIDPVHECIEFGGNILESDICITHRKLHGNSDRNLMILKKMVSQGKELSPRNIFYYARELHLNGMYDDAIIYFNKFLDIGKGTENENLNVCVDLANCYNAKGDRQNSLKTLIRSFEFDVPRAEVCCNIGYYYKDNKDFKKAIAWFEISTMLKKPDSTWITIHHDYWDYIPYVELSNCYFKLGDINKAIYYIDRAAMFKPDDPLVKHNQQYFDAIVKNLKTS